jgi:hypothetical protein
VKAENRNVKSNANIAAGPTDDIRLKEVNLSIENAIPVEFGSIPLIKKSISPLKLRVIAES